MMLTLIEESRPAELIGSPSGHLGCLAGLFKAIQACWGPQFWPEAVTLYKVRAALHGSDLPEERLYALYALDWSSRR